QYRDRERGREEQVEHRLVAAQVEAADLELDPRVELELPLGLVLVVAPLVAERRAEEDRQPDDGAEPEEHLGPGAELVQPVAHTRGGPCSKGRSASPMKNEIVNAARNSTAAQSPALLLTARPTRSEERRVGNERRAREG